MDQPEIAPTAPQAPTALPEVGQVPAQTFVWPTRISTIQLRERDKKGQLLYLDSGVPAIAWRAEFVLLTLAGLPSTVRVPPIEDLVAADTSLAAIEAKALALCHTTLRRSGAVNGAPK